MLNFIIFHLKTINVRFYLLQEKEDKSLESLDIEFEFKS